MGGDQSLDQQYVSYFAPTLRPAFVLKLTTQKWKEKHHLHIEMSLGEAHFLS